MMVDICQNRPWSIGLFLLLNSTCILDSERHTFNLMMKVSQPLKMYSWVMEMSHNECLSSMCKAQPSNFSNFPCSSTRYPLICSQDYVYFCNMTLPALETSFSRNHYFNEHLNIEVNVKSVLWEARHGSPCL